MPMNKELLRKIEEFLIDHKNLGFSSAERLLDEFQSELAKPTCRQEPLSDDLIYEIKNGMPLRTTHYEFARAIERAHGIGD